MIMLCETCENQSYSTGDRGLYIFEYSSKIYGQSVLCFLETQDTLAQITSFTVYYTKDRISRVTKTVDRSRYKYQKKEDGNVYVDGLKVMCCDSGNFNEKKKVNSADFYKLLSANFLEKDNKERLEILNKLSQYGIYSSSYLYQIPK